MVLSHYPLNLHFPRGCDFRHEPPQTAWYEILKKKKVKLIKKFFLNLKIKKKKKKAEYQWLLPIILAT
jgi:hypothetical protein